MHRRRHSKIRLPQFVQRLAKIDFAQFRAALQDTQSPAHFKVQLFRELPPICFIEKHSADAQLQCQLNSFALSWIEPHQFVAWDRSDDPHLQPWRKLGYPLRYL